MNWANGSHKRNRLNKPDTTRTRRLHSTGLKQDNSRSRLQGIALVSLAYLNFAILIACAKWLGQRLPVIEVVWLRFTVHAALSMLILWPQIGSSLVRSKKPSWQLTRALMMCAMTVANFKAVQYLSLDVNSAILFFTPLLVAVFGVWLLGEKLDRGRWIAIGIGFIGVLVILRPGTDGFHVAMLLTLFATILYALFGLLTRQLAIHDAPASTQFLGTLGGVFLLAPFAWIQWQSPADWHQWMIIFLIGFVGTFGHWCWATAHQFAPASTITPFMYMQIVYVMIIGYFLFNDIPDTAVYAGTAIVMASGLYLLRRERTLNSAN